MQPQLTPYVASHDHAGDGFSLNRDEVVRTGRWREIRRTAVVALVLLAAELPMRLAATGELDSSFGFPAVVPGRLSLVLDSLLVIAYLLVSYRACVLAHGTAIDRPGPAGRAGTGEPASRYEASARLRRLDIAGLAMVALGGALDLVENGVLWFRLAGAGAEASLCVPLLSWSVVVLVPLGLAVQGATLAAMWRQRRRGAAKRPADDRPRPPKPDPHGTVICCSGGGIRSSAFSLGGLQALMDAGIYRDARMVVGVSGGGYVAAAYHVLRWQQGGDRGHPQWQPLEAGPPPFTTGTPEMAWIRRHTRYVADSLQVAAQGALSLAFGIGVNLLLLASALGALAWLLAWLLLASGRIQPWPAGDHRQLGDPAAVATIGGDAQAAWCLEWAWLLPAAGLGCFLLVQVWEKLVGCPAPVQRVLGAATTWLLVGGGAATALLLGVPWVLEGLTGYAVSSDSALAGLLHQLGLVPTQVCNDVLSTGASACGVEGAEVGTTSAKAVSAVSFAAVVSSILAVMASAKSAAGPTADATGRLGRALRSAWAKLKDPVVPWGAVLLIVAVLLLVLLRWVAAFVEESGLFLRWEYMYVVGGLLLAAKVGTEPNRTSLHHFFRERISTAFLLRRTGGGVEPVPYRRPLRFSDAQPRDGGPGLVACAVANVADQELIPSRRGCTPFVFDHDRIGLTDPLLPRSDAQRASAAYEFAADSRYRDATVPAAVAISAAAFSPLAGRENVRLGPYRAVLALGNARLGVWLPNPLWVDEGRLAYRLLRLGRWEEAAAVIDQAGDGGCADLTPGDRARLEHGRRRARIAAADAAVTRALACGDPDRGRAREREALDLAADALGRPRRRPWSLTAARADLLAALQEIPGPGRSVRLWRAYELARNVVKKPGLAKLVKEGIGKASVYDRFLYVTDGGHYDNLGLIEALRRRPRRVILLDASNDAEDTFKALGRAIATARMDLGLEVEMDPRGMRRVPDGRSPAGWRAGTYRETSAPPDQVLGHVYLVKAIMLDGLPWDIETYSGENREFPRTSTGRQLYSEFDFEAYRMLGQVTTRTMLDGTAGGTTLGTRPAAASGPHAVEPPDEDEAA